MKEATRLVSGASAPNPRRALHAAGEPGEPPLRASGALRAAAFPAAHGHRREAQGIRIKLIRAKPKERKPQSPPRSENPFSENILVGMQGTRWNPTEGACRYVVLIGVRVFLIG